LLLPPVLLSTSGFICTGRRRHLSLTPSFLCPLLQANQLLLLLLLLPQRRLIVAATLIAY
jgi:hypothetical protein